MRRLSAVIVLFLPLICLSAAGSDRLDSLLRVYDEEVGRSDYYLMRRQAHIDSMRRIDDSPEMLFRIAEEYSSYQSDSARMYYSRLADAGGPLSLEARISLVKLYQAIGLYGDGLVIAGSVKDVPEKLRMQWYDAMVRLYTGAAGQTTLAHYRQLFQNKADLYGDSLMEEKRLRAQYSDRDRLEYEYMDARDKGDYAGALSVNDSLLQLIPPFSHDYAIHAYRRADLYGKQGYTAKHNEWLVLSAIADVRSGVTDNGSSWLVAQHCYEADEIERAYRYIDYSLTNAAFFNAPTRYIQTHPVGHIISTAHEAQQRKNTIRLIMALTVSSFILAALILIAGYAFRQNLKLHKLNKDVLRMNNMLHDTNRSLEEANRVKEQYICRYLEVYSDYIRRLTSMARKAGEKDPSDFMNREMDDFYRSFDDTFLSLYGTFVQDFNALLRPEARITPKPGERMTIEMRIFALILLGINSSAKIAELLCYSPNTISNYRVKIKNNALGNRDTFEEQVKQIGRWRFE